MDSAVPQSEEEYQQQHSNRGSGTFIGVDPEKQEKQSDKGLDLATHSVTSSGLKKVLFVEGDPEVSQY
jgi:hypothetical protein